MPPAPPSKSSIPNSHLYSRESGIDKFWPPRVVWARELGWLNVRDPWGQWHQIPLKEAPSGWGQLANLARRGWT